MKINLFNALVVALPALSLTAASFLPETHAQQRRPSRRASVPVRQSQPAPAPPQSGTTSDSEPVIVSTAGDDAQEEEAAPRTATRRTRPAATNAIGETEQLRRTVNRLSSQVSKLSEDLTQMKTDQRSLVDLERLTRAEQRAENLRAQLRDVTDKEFALQERAAQLEDELQPDAIERRAAIVGSLRASEVRDQVRRTIERERERVRAQLELLTNSRSRLEAAVASADVEVDRIRRRVEAAEREDNPDPGPSEAINTATPRPAPTPIGTQPPTEPPSNRR